MTNKDYHKQKIISALRMTDSDNLERAERAFRHYSPAQMQEEHGQTGQTHQQILDGYRKARADTNETIAWVEAS